VRPALPLSRRRHAGAEDGLRHVGRISSGSVADRIGGLRTLLGSALQGVALLLYLRYDGVTSLYVMSAVFGLFQGAMREIFRPAP
jgi:hypothetical protein